MITREQIQQLLQFRNGPYLVTSCYFNLDRAQTPPQGLKIRVKDLLQNARRSLQNKTGTHEQRESLQRDFDQIEAYLQQDILGARHKALAIFSCAGEKLWQVYPLSHMVRNILVAETAPYVRPLSIILSQQRRYCVALVDRVQAKLFEVYMGEAQEHAMTVDSVPRRVREGGQGGRDERNIERNRDAAVHQHFENVAGTMLSLLKQHEFDTVVLGGHHEVLAEFRPHLHAYLQSRLVGEFSAEPGRATADDVFRQVEELDQRLQSERERVSAADLVRKAGEARGAVAGVGATLAVLSRGEAELLLVEEGFETPGWLCRSCQHASLDAQECPQCRQPAERCADIVDEAVALAFHKRCAVQHVLSHTPLREAGRIGALLRY